MKKRNLLVSKVQILPYFNDGTPTQVSVIDGVISNEDGEELSYIKVRLYSQYKMNVNVRVFQNDFDSFGFTNKKEIADYFNNSLITVEGQTVKEGEELSWSDEGLTATKTFFEVEQWIKENDPIVISDMQKKVRVMKMLINTESFSTVKDVEVIEETV